MRRLAALHVLFPLSILLTSAALAQPYPNHPIKLIVGGAAGSVPDTMVRPIAERLAAALGQPVVVENRPGAAGIIAMEALVHSAPDGYTLALATMSQAVFNSYLFAKLSYDPQRDLQPVAPLVTGAMVVAAHPSFPARSMQELVVKARAEPGRLFVGMPQAGSPPHVVALLLTRASGIEVTMVPHKAGADAIAAVLGGQIPLVIDAPTIIAPHMKAGRLKALVVTGREREPELADVPTAIESGFAGVEGEAWIGVVAPSGTPMTIVTRLNQELGRVLDSTDVQKIMAAFSFRTMTASPGEFARMISEDHAKWGAVIRGAGIRID